MTTNGRDEWDSDPSSDDVIVAQEQRPTYLPFVVQVNNVQFADCASLRAAYMVRRCIATVNTSVWYRRVDGTRVQVG